MTYKNGDIITLLYAASNYAYNVAYNIQLEVKGTVKKDYRAWKYQNFQQQNGNMKYQVIR